MPDSVADHRESSIPHLRAKAMQAVESERSVIANAAFERRDLARESIEEKNQSRGPIPVFRRARLSRRSNASKIVAVFFTSRGAAI